MCHSGWMRMQFMGLHDSRLHSLFNSVLAARPSITRSTLRYITHTCTHTHIHTHTHTQMHMHACLMVGRHRIVLGARHGCTENYGAVNVVSARAGSGLGDWVHEARSPCMPRLTSQSYPLKPARVATYDVGSRLSATIILIRN